MTTERCDVRSGAWPIIDIREKYNRGERQGMNEHITGVLILLVDLFKAQISLTKNKTLQYKIRAIENAVEALASCPDDIKSGRQAQALEGIGKGIGGRIDEILETGTLVELTSIDTNYVTCVKELTKIHGIGPAKARVLIVDHNIRSVLDLMRCAPCLNLTHQQVIGLKYADDLKERIPRDEMEEVKRALAAALPTADFELCGSYRREKQTSGDIDVLFNGSRSPCLPDIVASLFKQGLMIDSLMSESHETKYMGIFRLTPSGRARRIDIMWSTAEEMPAARLHLTGSGELNRMMRTVALQRGYTLTSEGVYPLKNGAKGAPLPVKCEEDIFNVLGIKYLTPSERSL